MHKAEKGEGYFTLYIVALNAEQQKKWVTALKKRKWGQTKKLAMFTVTQLTLFFMLTFLC